jgi:pimeloyl-ACP methyl ester carboxylesterase
VAFVHGNPGSSRDWGAAGCGHWPFADNPEAVEGLVAPFLRDCFGA